MTAEGTAGSATSRSKSVNMASQSPCRSHCPRLGVSSKFHFRVFPVYIPKAKGGGVEVNAQVTQEQLLEGPASLPLPSRMISGSSNGATLGAGSR